MSTPVQPSEDETLSRVAEPSDDQTLLWASDSSKLSKLVCEWLVDDGRLSIDSIDVVREAIQNCLPKVGSVSDHPPESIEFSSDELSDFSAGPTSVKRDVLKVGQVVAKYRVTDTLGRGGSGLVYAVEHVDTGQSLALKVLNQPDASNRFQREMDLVCRLAHPNIVFAHEVGQADGHWYIAMERLHGPDIRQRIIKDGPLPWQETLPIIYQIAGALQQAHARGLVHRDVKPGNLICDGEGVVKLADLGLAIWTASLPPHELDQNGDPDQSDDAAFHTRVEALGGTPGYMAPEQAQSLAAADHRSDVYSLAATWYYMLTGNAMVPGETWSSRLSELIRGDRIETLQPHQLPDPFLTMWKSMVIRDPSKRLSTVNEVLETMEQHWDKKDLGGADRSIRLLVVEDDQDDLFITLQSLRRFNTAVEVHSAQSLEEGIRSATDNPVEVVLLDLQLPDASGLETVSQFREAFPSIVIIVLSGRDDEGIDQACRLRGADEFVSKHSIGVPELERLIFIAMARRK